MDHSPKESDIRLPTLNFSLPTHPIGNDFGASVPSASTRPCVLLNHPVDPHTGRVVHSWQHFGDAATSFPLASRNKKNKSRNKDNSHMSWSFGHSLWTKSGRRNCGYVRYNLCFVFVYSKLTKQMSCSGCLISSHAIQFRTPSLAKSKVPPHGVGGSMVSADGPVSTP